jgi:hypothetical protein
MASSLIVVPYAAELAHLVKGFNCGDEPSERELAEWLENDALRFLKRGTSVWLFMTEER